MRETDVLWRRGIWRKQKTGGKTGRGVRQQQQMKSILLRQRHGRKAMTNVTYKQCKQFMPKTHHRMSNREREEREGGERRRVRLLRWRVRARGDKTALGCDVWGGEIAEKTEKMERAIAVATAECSGPGIMRH